MSRILLFDDMLGVNFSVVHNQAGFASTETSPRHGQ